QVLAGLALAAATLLAGCLAESEHPIAPADPAKNDARLWGSWLSEGEDDYIIAHVFATEGGTLQIAIAEHDVEGIGKIDTYDAHVTKLPSGDYLNVVVTGSEAGYVIGKYEFEGTDKLSVWFPQNDTLAQAVKDGSLAGTTTVEGSDTDVRITASSEQWQAFLAKAPAEFFGEPTSFKRVGPAYVEQQ
ncbi:MAG: hypothetical protein ACREEP_15285, partial [Dongiaceae bacterium]